MNYESDFLISIPDKIINHLFFLFKSKCLLTAYFGDNEESFITTILDIDKKHNVFSFYHSPKENSIEPLLNSSKITFKTRYLGAEVIFETTRLKKIQHQELLAFAVPMPASILWLERREFYRVRLPVSKPSYCQLTLKNNTAITLKLYDISLGGFSMLTDSNEVSDLMTLYTTFEQGKLILANTETGSISFEIRSQYNINSEYLKIGCKLIRITPVFQNAIQSCMNQIERENRKNEKS